MTFSPRSFLLAAALTAVAAAAASAQPFFDYDKKSDVSVFRPSEGSWYTSSSEADSIAATQWGLATDRLVPGDYDGDGITDLAVWRPETGVWYVLRSRDGQMQTATWGTRLFIPNGWVTDEPVPGDYDGDGHDDFAVWRPGTGVWYILRSTFGFNPDYALTIRWGKLGDIPVPGDYDGDRVTDAAVFRSTENRWYALGSSDSVWRTTVLGQSGFDKLVPADYTGDGRTDFAVYRNGLWIIEDVARGARQSVNYGLSGDTPVPADYDGDGRAEPAVYRAGRWFIFESGTGLSETRDFGTSSDVPLPALRVKPSIVPIP
jgi:hypothetical protein